MSCREIAEEFKINEPQAASAVANEARLRAEYGNIHGKKVTNTFNGENLKPSTTYSTTGTRDMKPHAFTSLYPSWNRKLWT